MVGPTVAFVGVVLTPNAVAESFHSDDVSSLAQRVSESIAALCPNVPTDQREELATRLAVTELAHAVDTASTLSDLELESASAGNQVVWLPGACRSAIVLPAGEEPPNAAEKAAQLLALMRRHLASAGRMASRGSVALRQAGTALLSAHQAPPRVQ